ncbi:MAG: DMT family transporter [Pseudomonadales bacterium]
MSDTVNTKSLSPFATSGYTLLALVAFAANSVLCRLALGDAQIDAASFTVIRLLSGIVTLLLLLQLRQNKGPANPQGGARGSWAAAFYLFLYALGFSYAYISLETGTGALILFGVVQLTMIAASLLQGNRLHAIEWLGVALAFAGFVYLVLPGVSAPSPEGLVLMSVAGIAWAFYTLNGRGSRDPLSDTSYNFARTLPFVGLLAIYGFSEMELSLYGVVLAVVSGAVTSGIGYSIWYLALSALKTLHAAVLQLSVPVIAALGGVLFVSEPMTLRLVLSGLLILGGILLVVLGKRWAANRAQKAKA